MVAPWRAPRADVSEAAESWPELLQPLPHHIVLKKKERKIGGGGEWGGWVMGRGQNKGEKQRWSVGEGSPGWGPASVGVRV